MKYNIFAVLFLLFFSSCEDFLEEKPKDRIIPMSVKEYDELLYGEAYMRGSDNIASYLDLLSDDVKSYAKTFGLGIDARDYTYGYYAWQPDPEMTIAGARNDDEAWPWFYHSILMCNLTLNDLPDVDGDIADKEDLMAEAHFLRAWDYFMLVNLYGEPYIESSAASDLGVPINDVTGMEDKQFTRSSVAVVYEQIEEDLEAAIELFLSSNKEKDNFRANISATYLLASRVALYKKDYKKAIEFATLALEDKSVLYDLNTKNSADKFINYKNPEILFSFGDYLAHFYMNTYFNIANYPASEDLGNLFVANDLRQSSFLKSNMPAKNDRPTKTGMFGFAMRTAELYLNRAEAYAELGELENAMDDINQLRESRFSSDDYLLTAASKEEAIQIVRDERRMELCFEKHRWFDLRRWGRPSITHVFVRDKQNDIEETYILKKDDPAYTLPLPYAVTINNKDMINIDRPVRNPEN